MTDRRPRRPRRWPAVAAVVVGVAAVLVMFVTQRPAAPDTRTATDVEPASTSAAPDPTGVPTTTATARPRKSSPTRQAESGTGPQHLTIPSIGVSAAVVRLGLNDDETVEVPDDAAQAGWFDLGPVPGRLGSSVVLGHVDSVDGPAVFDRLDELGPGDTVEVHLGGGSVATFRVDRVATYANEDFPAQEVYAGDPAGRALNLVTCGGEYDAARGGWQSNVVVFTSHVGTA